MRNKVDLRQSMIPVKAGIMVSTPHRGHRVINLTCSIGACAAVRLFPLPIHSPISFLI
jgi:hypothetical protein